MASLLGAIPATTHKHMLKATADAIFKGNPMFKMLYDDADMLGGGELINATLAIRRSNGGPYSRYDTLVAPDGQNVDSARYEFKQFYASEAIDGLSKAQNSGVEAAIDYWGTKLEVMKLTLGDDLANSTLQARTGATTTQDLTLIEDIVGAGTVEVGSLTSTEVPLWAGGSVAASAADSSGAALTYGALLSSYMACVQGDVRPKLMLASNAGYSDVVRLMEAHQRFTGSDNTFGFENIKFHNAIVVADDHVPDSGGSVFTGKRIFIINPDFLRLHIHKDHNFRLKEVEPDLQDAHFAFLFIYLNLVCNNRRFQGVRHNFISPA